MAFVNPIVPVLLSALPGLGQAFNGDRFRALAFLSMSLPLIALGASLVSWAGLDVATAVKSVGPLYVLVLVPAAREAWRAATGNGPGPWVGDNRTYVVVMLGLVGPLALPLLWQSSRFGRGAKVTWTVLIAAVCAAATWTIITAAPLLQELLRDLETLRSAGEAGVLR
jgi:hypothetical protein